MPVERVELLTLTEFARRVGVTVGRISQLVKSGKIPVTPQKRIIWPAARDLWDATHLDQPAAPSASQPATSASEAHRVTLSATEDATSLAVARARKEAARARLAELDLAEREAILIPVDEVRADAHAVLGSVRASLLALPGQLSLRCEGKNAAEIEAVIGEAVNTLLSEWHQGRFGCE